MDVVKSVLIQDPNCLLYRNEIGHNTHFPDGTKRKNPIRYGIHNPGGADLIGCYGPRLLAIETKTVRGTQSPEQMNFERHVSARGGVYALIRSEPEARELLAILRAGTPLPLHLRGGGHPHPGITT